MEAWLEQCHGGRIGTGWRTGAEPLRVHWSSAVGDVLGQCSEGSTGAVQWSEARGNTIQGVLKMCSAVENGAVQFHEHWSSAMEGRMK